MSEEKSDRLVYRVGEKVVIRPILRADIPKLLIWINDPEVNQYLTSYLPMMEKDEEDWLERLQKDKSSKITFAIETIEGKFIGVMGLHDIQWRNRTAKTGAMIGEKEYWGKGYGSEAKMLLLEYAFNTLNLRKICSEVIAFNKRSCAYSLKCGYRIEGRLKKHCFAKGKYWDLIQLAIFREDYMRAKSRIKSRKS